jgi:predicted nucleotidyltransferase component of viral defense system
MSLDIAKHKNILIKILKDIFTDPTIGPLLGFKGGTATYLFYNLDRFSIDLDFDLLNEMKGDYVFNRVKTILEGYGKLKEAKKKRFNLFYLLSYDKKDINAQNIKVEINRRDFGSKYDLKSYLGISMKVMVKEDMAAHKLCAMYERIGKTNRDIFDVHFFLIHDWPINKQIIENRTRMSYREFLGKSVEVLEKFDDKDILAGMGEFLTEKQKAWAKASLKKDVLFLLKLKLENEK